MHSIYNYMQIIMWKKKRKKEQAKQPASLHGMSDTPNTWNDK